MSGSNNSKILITGNGFDLAHNLPTSYQDFINFVLAFESYKGDKSQITFDAIFATSDSKFRKSWVEEVRRHYATVRMIFDLSVFDGKLNNAWLNYFKPIQNIETWIDFEIEIGEALKIVAEFCNFCDDKLESSSSISGINHGGEGVNGWYHYQSSKSICLHRLGVVEGISDRYNRIDVNENHSSKMLKDVCFKGGVRTNIRSLDKSQITSHLLKQLDEFIALFGNYLNIITNEFHRYVNIDMLVGLDRYAEIFTLNYTKTIPNLYSSINTSNVYYLHGEVGSANNIVLGVAALEAETLGVQALGFTKYYQTLFKETEFGFLDKNNKYLKRSEPVDYFIWGHSLDRSDEKYIRRLFEEISDTSEFNWSRITIYFHCKNSKASLLKNLLAIIGKDVIEEAIRLGFLKFLKAPYIWKDKLL
jgi:Bacteriophage abortive infection AbiH